MIDAVTYGMIPSAKSEKRESAPPEKRLSSPRMLPPPCPPKYWLTARSSLQGRVVRAEAGLAVSRRASLEAWLRSLPLVNVELAMQQPLPLRRLLLHHRFGLPALGKVRIVAGTLGMLERVAGRLLPRSRWSYYVFSARRTG